jgi:hypothetical protein
MIWWAYAGLSGAIVFSVLSAAWMMGMPKDGLVNLVIDSSLLMLAVAMLANILGIVFRRPVN